MAFPAVRSILPHLHVGSDVWKWCEAWKVQDERDANYLCGEVWGGKISVGNGLRMNNGNSANNIGFSAPCSLMAIGGAHLLIHDNVGMSQTALCAVGADITIGRNTLLGGGVRVYSSDFHSLHYIDRRDEKVDSSKRQSAPVVIGEDCFIGAGTVILKGVTIGDRTIIGAGSVVTKSIPADCIAAGNPCKIIKYAR